MQLEQFHDLSQLQRRDRGSAAVVSLTEGNSIGPSLLVSLLLVSLLLVPLLLMVGWFIGHVPDVRLLSLLLSLGRGLSDDIQLEM